MLRKWPAMSGLLYSSFLLKKSGPKRKVRNGSTGYSICLKSSQPTRNQSVMLFWAKGIAFILRKWPAMSGLLYSSFLLKKSGPKRKVRNGSTGYSICLKSSQPTRNQSVMLFWAKGIAFILRKWPAMSGLLYSSFLLKKSGPKRKVRNGSTGYSICLKSSQPTRNQSVMLFWAKGIAFILRKWPAMSGLLYSSFLLKKSGPKRKVRNGSTGYSICLKSSQPTRNQSVMLFWAKGIAFILRKWPAMSGLLYSSFLLKKSGPKRKVRNGSTGYSICLKSSQPTRNQSVMLFWAKGIAFILRKWPAMSGLLYSSFLLKKSGPKRKVRNGSTGYSICLK